MKTTTSHFVNHLKTGASGQFQAKGVQIMALADLICKALRGKLDGCRDHNDMPMEPAKVRAIALNTAQRYFKATASS